MVGVIPDGERASLAMRIDELRRNEVGVWVDTVPVAYGERMVFDGVGNGTPDVDDANSAFEETVGFFRKVVVHTFDASFESLIDVNACLLNM